MLYNPPFIGLLPRIKPVAMAFLPYSLLLGTLNANSVLYFHRNPAARATFGATTLKVLLIGALTAHVCQISPSLCVLVASKLIATADALLGLTKAMTDGYRQGTVRQVYVVDSREWWSVHKLIQWRCHACAHQVH